jgi:hypothetical protein
VLVIACFSRGFFYLLPRFALGDLRLTHLRADIPLALVAPTAVTTLLLDESARSSLTCPLVTLISPKTGTTSTAEPLNKENHQETCQ